MNAGLKLVANIPIYEVQNIEPKINNMKVKQPNQTNYAVWAEYYGDRIKKMCDEVTANRKK